VPPVNPPPCRPSRRSRRAASPCRRRYPPAAEGQRVAGDDPPSPPSACTSLTSPRRGGGEIVPLTILFDFPVAVAASPGEPTGRGAVTLPGSGRLRRRHTVTATPPPTPPLAPPCSARAGVGAELRRLTLPTPRMWMRLCRLLRPTAATLPHHQVDVGRDGALW